MPKLILVIEDHPDIRMGLGHLIKRLGYKSIMAPSVREGVEKLRDRPTHVILDLNFPDGNGTTVLQYVRLKRLPIKVAIVSGTDDQDLLNVAKALQPDAIIPKPDWDAVMDWISQ